MNQILEVYLCCYINYNQDNWVQILPIAQFVYNSTISEPIRVLLFFANKGYNPTVYKQPRADKVSAQEAVVQASRLKQLYYQLGLDLEFCRQKTAGYTNKKQSQEPLFKKGDKVYLLQQNIKTRRLYSKLDFKKLGLFEIAEKVSSVNYRLKLPKLSRLYPVFYILLLEPVKGTVPVDETTDIQPEHEIYNIEKILDSKVSRRTTMYLVKWLDWDDLYNS